MADGIDPNIALSYRPPNLATMPNLQIQTPLEGLARVVSLRNLMQEGQLKGLQLQQLRLQLQGAQNLANLYSSMYPETDTGIPGATPGSQYSTGAGLPAAPAGGTTTPTYSIPPPAPLAGGAPVTPAGVDVTAGLDKYLTPPVAAPTTAPGADTGTAQAPIEAPPPGLFAPPPEPRAPSLAQFVRADPLGGVAAYEQMMKARKEMYDEADKRLTLRKNQSESVANLLNGVTDQESLVRNLPEMVRTGAISGAQADYIMKRGFDDPFVQKWINEKQIQSIGYDKAIDTAIKQHGENRAQLLFPPQLSKAMTDQQAGERQNAADTVGQVQDDKGWAEWFKAQGPTAQALYAPIITNPNLSFTQKQQIIQMGAGGAQKVTEAARTATATEAARTAAKIQQYEPLIQSILSGKDSLQDQSQAVQDIIEPEIRRRQAAGTITAPPEPAAPGAAPAGAPAPATGTPAAGGGAPVPSTGAPAAPPQAPVPVQFGKRPSDAEVQRLSDLQRAFTVVNDLQNKIREQPSQDMMGPIVGRMALNPYATAPRALSDYLGNAQQHIKKYVTNGSLRGVTETQLNQMVPSITTHPDEANQQVVQLKNMIRGEYEQAVKDLQGAGKVVPEALIPKTAPAPQAAPPAAPSRQPQAAPVKIPADVEKQLNRGAGKYTLPDGRVFYKKKDGSIVPGQ